MEQEKVNWNDIRLDLKKFVIKRVKDQSLAEDIVQDVFLKVQEKAQQLKKEERILGWIYQITRNTIVDHYRKTAKTINAADVDWQSSAPNFNECVTERLSALVRTLPDMYRIPLEMSALANVSQLELASKLNLSYPAARSRVQRARQMLKAKVDEIMIVETDGYGNVVLCESRGCC